jgi:alpha-glucosidase
MFHLALLLLASTASPDGRIAVDVTLNDEGRPSYAVSLEGKPVVQPSGLGLVREDADFSRGLKLERASGIERIEDRYELLTSKRRHNHYVANQRTFDLRSAGGKAMQVIFQVSNDGVAFRYRFPDSSPTLHRLKSEASSYNFLPGTVAWLQPMSVAKTGWKEVNPSYEELYEKEIVVGTPSPTGAGWVYPALFRSGDVWLLVSEGSLPPNYAGTRLRSTWRSTEYTVSFPDPLEGMDDGPVNPESTLPWITPWRFIVIGSLATVVESTLGTDLADKPPAGASTPPAMPGKASWSWPLMGDDHTTFDVQKRFIDYAAAMRWQYTLIDALWDTQIGYEKLQELIDYARTKGVRILVWYNSAGACNSAPQTPRGRLLTHESRIREFERLKAMGVAGLKVDFFCGDGQSVIAYYRDILEDAAPYGFAMNFHGATLPRGWHRTFPNLMTTEAVRGLEFVTFEQKNAEDEPSHAAMLPFTRNVFDPMDFTPVVLDRIQRIERRTTSAFELALAVLFTSGIQHYAEIPEGMAKAPDYVQDFLRQLPSVWDDVRFLDGYPGRYVVITRGGVGKCYVAGINAQSTAMTVKLALSGPGTLISDGKGGNLSFRTERVGLATDGSFTVPVKARGGFVITLEDNCRSGKRHARASAGPDPSSER